MVVVDLFPFVPDWFRVAIHALDVLLEVLVSLAGKLLVVARLISHFPLILEDWRVLLQLVGRDRARALVVPESLRLSPSGLVRLRVVSRVQGLDRVQVV